ADADLRDPPTDLEAEVRLSRLHGAGGLERARVVAARTEREPRTQPDQRVHDGYCDHTPGHDPVPRLRASHSSESSPVMRASSMRAAISACRASVRAARARNSSASAAR